MLRIPTQLILSLACVFSLAAYAPTASAAFVTTGAPDTNIFYFGDPDTTSYGQTFKALDSVLTDWSFYVAGATGNFDLRVANWDGSKAVGPQLFSVSSTTAATSASSLGNTKYSWSGINLSLATGSTYIAYITVAGVSGPTAQVPVGGHSSDAYADGGFFFLNSGGADPLSSSDSWSSWFVPDMAFEANFASASPVPEPASLAAWSFGLVAVTFARRRKAKATA